MDTVLYTMLKNKITEIRQKLLNVVEDATDMNSRIVQNTNNIDKKLDKNQGASNSGKITGINESGDIVPMFPQGVTYNEDTQCLEYGADEKLNLNAGIQLDDTLSKVGYAADAASVGELKSDLSQLSEEIADLPQPDWNQNDETAQDYVKNRPFYTGDPVEIDIIPATTVTFSEDSGIMAALWPESFDLVDGKTYCVSWDGTDYVCTGILFNGVAQILGNLGLIGVGDDTGEPFIFMNKGQWLVGSTESATEHIIGIKTGTIPIVTLDEKYLPKASEDSYGIIKMSDVVSVYNFPANVAHDQMVDAITAFETGNASIVWDGNKVITASYSSSDDTITVSFAHNPLKFITYTNANGLYICTLGSPTYGELQGRKVRIGNDDTVYAVLSVEGESNNRTLNVLAERISIDTLYGMSSTEMILHSSTEGSNKIFKITVDDSGTITATEVV